jgi:hypothetical protein
MFLVSSRVGCWLITGIERGVVLGLYDVGLNGRGIDVYVVLGKSWCAVMWV